MGQADHPRGSQRREPRGGAVAASEWAADAARAWPEELSYTVQDSLFEAALLALRAPSIANTQPWRWQVRPQALDLRADRARQLTLDPTGRLLTVSCGAALHHARVMLAVQGCQAEVRRLPELGDADLVARLLVTGACEVTAEDTRRHRAIRVRRSDRRPFVASSPLAVDVLERVCDAAREQGAAATPIESAELRFLGFASTGAATIEAQAMACQDDFADWSVRTTDHPPGHAGTLPAPDAEGALHGDDRFARFVVISTDGDEPLDWIRAGEGTSAALLEATAEGLASSMLSEAVEVPGARVLLRSVAGKLRYPQLVLRLGVNETPRPTQDSKRRDASDAIEIID